ncbi:unnamed protein product [Ectocarpus fasciculatus]
MHYAFKVYNVIIHSPNDDGPARKLSGRRSNLDYSSSVALSTSTLCCVENTGQLLDCLESAARAERSGEPQDILLYSSSTQESRQRIETRAAGDGAMSTDDRHPT